MYIYDCYIKDLRGNLKQLHVLIDDLNILEGPGETCMERMSRNLDDLISFFAEVGYDDSELRKLRKEMNLNNLSPLDIHRKINSLTKVIHDKLSDQISVHTKLINIINTFILICIFLILLLLFRVVNEVESLKRSEELKERMNEQLIKIIERDRHIISCELHDDLAQKLSQINMYFNSPSQDPEAFNLLKKYSGEAIHQIRILSNRLKSPYIYHSQFDEAFINLFSDFKVMTNLNLNYNLIGVKNLKLDEDKTVHLYRIVQELLNNALKHSQAESVNISIIYSHPEILVKYSDNGIGYDLSKIGPSGQGLNSIRFRMEILNAVWSSLNTKGNGVRLSIKVPV